PLLALKRLQKTPRNKHQLMQTISRIIMRGSFYDFPQQFLYFLPLPQGHGSFRPILVAVRLAGNWIISAPAFFNPVSFRYNSFGVWPWFRQSRVLFCTSTRRFASFMGSASPLNSTPTESIRSKYS